jgi:sugar phosphate isomerase/epimerase
LHEANPMKRKNHDSTISRRKFMGTAVLTATGLTLSGSNVLGFPNILPHLNRPNSVIDGVQLGVITYSFRSLPCNAEQIIQYCKEAGVSSIELMGNTGESFAGAPHTSTEPYAFPAGPRPQPTPEQQAERQARAKELADWRAAVSTEKFEKLRKLFKEAGISVYAWKPNALGERSTDAEIDYTFRSARALGATHVTVELPGNVAHSKRLGEFAQRYKLGVGYHGHLQQTFTAWDEALAQSDYNGLNCDIGHYVAAGYDPVPLLESKHERIYSMHVKDRKSKENGGDNVPWGEGDTPIVKVLQLMKKNQYKFPATIELEYNIPEGSNAIKEVARCAEFCRKALTT